MSKFLNLFIKGIFVGVANVIPGVSGGTIAVVLRIFDEMIDALNNIFKDFKKHINFLFPLLIGACAGIIFFSKIIKFCLSNYSLPTNLFFVGLVVGSIPLIYKTAATKKVKPIYFIYSIITFAIVVFMSFIKEPTNFNEVIKVDLFFIIKFFLGGIIASAAMVVPGISGSFVMVLLGMYNTIISSVSDFVDEIINAVKLISEKGEIVNAVMNIIKSDSFIILAAAGIGMIIGIVLISKVISLLLEKAFSVTYFGILGLIFGSIFAIFKDPITYQNGINIVAVLIGIIMFIIGFFISLFLGSER